MCLLVIKFTNLKLNKNNFFMSESGVKYVDIPEYNSADLGVDFDALLKELRELKRQLAINKEKIDFSKNMFSGDESFFGGVIAIDLVKKLKEHVSNSRSDIKSEDDVMEVIRDEAKKILENVSDRILKEVDPEHEIKFFGQVAELVDLVFEDDNTGEEKRKGPRLVGNYNSADDKITMDANFFAESRQSLVLLGDLMNSVSVQSLATLKHELVHKEQAKYKKGSISTEEKKRDLQKIFSDFGFVGATATLGVAEILPIYLNKFKSLPKEYHVVVALVYLGCISFSGICKIRDKIEQRQQSQQEYEEIYQGKILKESQAFITADRTRRFADLHKKFDKKQSEDGGGGYKEAINKKGDWDKLAMAYQQIKELYALGLSDEDVSELVGKATWNQDELAYDEFSARIKLEADKHGWDEEDVQNLVLAEDLREKIKLLKASRIAWEEFEKVVKS
jgi:hypothetical protein